MTVAAFFRDVRASNSVDSATSPQAEKLVRGFFAEHDYTDCSTAQLLALADLAARGNRYDVAREALTQALQRGDLVHRTRHKLGRVELAVEDYARAAEHFLAGTETDPGFPHNWIGAARSLLALGQTARAAELAETFAAFGVRPLIRSDLPVVAKLADVLFESQQRRRSLPLYKIVVAFGAANLRNSVRLAEALVASQDFAAALRVLRPLEAAGTLDVWARRTMANCLSRCSEHASGVAMAEAAMLERPDDKGFAGAYMDILARSRDAALIGDALARHSELLGALAVQELQIRIGLIGGDVEAAAAALAQADIQPRGRLLFLGLETAYAALHAGQPELTAMLATRLAAAAPDNIAARMLQVDILFREQDWDRAAACLASLPAESLETPQVLLKQFELACFLGRFAEAGPIWDKIAAGGLPTRQFMLPRFRFLAEKKQWSVIIDEALGWFDASFTYAQIGHLMFRAAKHTGRQMELVAAIEAVENWPAHADLARLRAVLKLDAAATHDDIDALLLDAAAPMQPAFRARLETRRDIMRRATVQPQKTALFLCTNGNYLCASLVALHSALRQIDKSRVDIFIVVDDDIATAATSYVQPYCAAGYTIAIVPAGQVVDAAEKLYPTYGLFTSGHMLASAAYYRIYFAKYLAGLGAYQRALYLDGDILLRAPLDRILQHDIQGRAIAARLEVPRAEVRRAIAMHNIADGRYFNSGVLLFDLAHSGLGSGLDGAVAAIGDDTVTLLYHDQCALNIGFRNGWADLPTEWNYPVHESTTIAELPQGAAVLHFLDRPKPWSAAYGGECAALWFQAWSELASFIGDAAALELLRMSTD